MSTPAQCDECQAILEELRNASAEICASPKLRDELRADCDALFKMMAGTEDDVDEVLGKFRFRPQQPGIREFRYPRVGDAVRKMFEHQTRTGHNVLLHR
jgi:hypothetical protein